jgi:fructokinase
MPKIYAIGETVYDIIFKDGKPVKAIAGGSMLNSAVSLGRLGLDVSFISDMGNDMVGDEIIRFLRENGINTTHIERYSNHNSGIAVAFLDEMNNASYTFYRDFPVNRLTNLRVEFLEDDIVLFGSFFALTREIRPALIKLLNQANEAGCIILYDPNFRKSHLHELEALRPFINENIHFADIVKGSDEDFQLIFGSNNGDQAHQSVLDEGCYNLVYTANRNGVEAHSPGLSLSFDVPKINVVSTIGAGDSFNAGLIWSMIQNGINKKDFEHLHNKIWNKMILNGIDFASEVCQSYENYISHDFALSKSVID